MTIDDGSPCAPRLDDIQREYLDDLRHRVSAAHYRNVELRLARTVRETDGLAMSSRNAYLDAPARAQAASLFAALGAQVLAVTDAEGTSAPERVAEFVAPLLRLGRVQQVLVCGSNRLIDLAARLAAPYGVDVQVSLEAHMACGIGYCHGCSHGAVGESEAAAG